MVIFNVYYKGGYIGYIVTHPIFNSEIMRSFMIEDLADQLKCNANLLKIEPKDQLPNSIFVRQVFNDHELGDDRSLVF